jgi:hypothetical protein
MAQSIRALAARTSSRAGSLIGRAKFGGPCDWASLGLNPQRLTYKEFDVANRGGSYIPHVGLSRPSYSPLRLRAAVAADYFFGPLGAEGYVCHFRRSVGDWRLQDCRLAFVA